MESGRDGKLWVSEKVCLNTPETDIDLSDEKTFLDYIRKPQTGFDSEIKYYRWSAQADFNGKEAEIRQILENRHSISPRNVIYYESNGKMRRTPWQILES